MLERILDAYRKAGNRILLVDYDGTIVPFNDDPANAGMDEQTREIISVVASNQANELVIISGRDGRFLERQFEKIPVTLIAEHGYMIRINNGEWFRTAETGVQWKEDVKNFMAGMLGMVAGSFIEEKESSLVFHYRTSPVSEELLHKLKMMVRDFGRNRDDLEILFGNHVIEIKVPGFSKGSAALKVINSRKYDFILAIGDDITDETLFKALKDRAFTIKVGEGETCAGYCIKSQAEVPGFLKLLTK